jgi:hypothetical protein
MILLGLTESSKLDQIRMLGGSCEVHSPIKHHVGPATKCLTEWGVLAQPSLRRRRPAKAALSGIAADKAAGTEGTVRDLYDAKAAAGRARGSYKSRDYTTTQLYILCQLLIV